MSVKNGRVEERKTQEVQTKGVYILKRKEHQRDTVFFGHIFIHVEMYFRVMYTQHKCRLLINAFGFAFEAFKTSLGLFGLSLCVFF